MLRGGVDQRAHHHHSSHTRSLSRCVASPPLRTPRVERLGEAQNVEHARPCREIAVACVWIARREPIAEAHEVKDVQHIRASGLVAIGIARIRGIDCHHLRQREDRNIGLEPRRLNTENCAHCGIHPRSWAVGPKSPITRNRPDQGQRRQGRLNLDRNRRLDDNRFIDFVRSRARTNSSGDCLVANPASEGDEARATGCSIAGGGCVGACANAGTG